MSKKFIEDIRRIAKTDEILKKIPNSTSDKDKASILSRRGTGYPAEQFDPCQFIYNTADDGSYTFANVIDGLGPKIPDGDVSDCTVINKITQCQDVDVAISMTLRPDGILTDEANGYYYTSNYIMDRYASNPEEFDSSSKWAFPSPEEAAIKSQEIYYNQYVGVLYSLSSGSPTTPELFPMPPEEVEGLNYSVNYPVYDVVISVTGSSVNPDDPWESYVESLGGRIEFTRTDPIVCPFYDPTLSYNSEETANTLTGSYINSHITYTSLNPRLPGNWMDVPPSFSTAGGSELISFYRSGNTFYWKYDESLFTLNEPVIIFSIPVSYDQTLFPGSEEFPTIVGPYHAFSNPNNISMNYYVDYDMPENSGGFELALDYNNNGLWVANPNDTATPNKYLNGVSIINLKFGASYTRYGQVRPTREGGFALLEYTDSSFTTLTGSAYIFRIDRTLQTVVPAAQAPAYLA
jgi:hypothetical protein